MNLSSLAAVSTGLGDIWNDFIVKLMTQLGVDAGNLTFATVSNRAVDLIFASAHIANVLALIGAVFYVTTLLMRTIVPLRAFAIVSGVFFLFYGLLAQSVTTFFLYVLLLPINGVRLYQMLKLVRRARVAAQGNLSMDWLKPFMTARNYRKGDVVFRKGAPANEMFITVSGSFLVTELAIELPAGRLVGELGFLTPGNRRTQSVECTQDGQVLSITYDKLLELYFQNPEFGYYFLRLTSERLLQNMARLEEIIEQNKDAIAQNQAKLEPMAAAPAS